MSGFQPGTSITWLPAVQHLTVSHSWYMEDLKEVPVFAWSALATLGLRCLGCEGLPLLAAVVQGCTGVPGYDSPWALVIYADLSTIEGLPLESFIEDDRHVWRNAAARNMLLDHM